MELKYGTWKISSYEPADARALCAAGFSPITAALLCSRGYRDAGAAREFLSCSYPLSSPFALLDMDKAAARVKQALARREHIAVFGDYDVDGITATCLLTEYLRSKGGHVTSYIPARLEEGYGLNPIAIDTLKKQGVELIVTVDCGITANHEAALCRELGIDLVITDHHECKSELPQAIALVDPHRKDQPQPVTEMAGVGVAFKLAAAIEGEQETLLDQYCDFLCLGTVADVMPLTGENRTMVARGLKALENPRRVGIAALMAECSVQKGPVTAGTIGYTLAPRINAAGRMGEVNVATELFLTHDAARAVELAGTLCRLNRRRQEIESSIYQSAVAMLPPGGPPQAIVLADESWHQGVVGIVASRIAEEYACPTFLICLDGEHGKASSRSHGGFNLFASLSALSPLLESYGGHELAAGFTISRANIPEFRRQICALAAKFYTDDVPRTVLDVDCAVSPELLTLHNVDALQMLEPCGNGCPKPVLMMKNLTIDRISMVGGGRHMRLRLCSGHTYLNAIYFSANPQTVSIQPGDLVDVAFTPQVNEFRGTRTVQMNVIDIRPSCNAECLPDAAPYRDMQRGNLTAGEAAALLPDRKMLALVWRYLDAANPVQESPVCLCRKIVRWSGKPLNLGQMLTCLDIFRDVGLLTVQRQHKYVSIRLTPGEGKADLSRSQTMQRLLHAKES